MDKKILSKIMSELGKRGGRARTKKLSPERRSEIARIAGSSHGKKFNQRKKNENTSNPKRS